MSIHKRQQQYEQSLREALDRYRYLTTINEWTLQKTEKKHLQPNTNISVQLWKYKDAYKVTLKCDLMATPPSWSLNAWRSILETDSLPGLNHMVEKRQVITRLDKHTRVSRIKMKDEWKFGSHERILIEQIIQHSTSLRYIGTSTQQDDLIQYSCLDIQYPANQPDQQFNVTFFCQLAPDPLSFVTSSEQLSIHIMSMVTGCLTSLSLYTPIPFINHQDPEIQLDYNTYDALNRTLDIKYHFGTNDNDTQDSRSPATTDTIKIHRNLTSHIPSQSRSWDPTYEPGLSSSLRKHDFMSSSLVFRPSSPGSSGHRLPPIGLTKKLSTVDLSSSSSYSSNTLQQDSSLAISKGEQLIIDIDGDNKHNNGDTTAHLTLQLLDSDDDLGPFFTNQFAQLCLRCIKYYPYDITTSASRHSLILHHPESLLGDLKLSQNTTQLSVRITLVLKFGTLEESSEKNVTTTGGMRLLLNGKQWPIRNTMPWDVTIDESDPDDDEGGYDGHGKNTEDDLDADPFMDSMEDVHESTTWNSNKQLNQRDLAQNSTSVKSLSVVESETSTSADSTGFSLAKKLHQINLKSALPIDELSQPSDTNKLEHSHSLLSPEISPTQEKSPKQRIQNKLEDKPLETDVKPLPGTLSQRRLPSSGKKMNIPHVDPPEMLKAYQYFDALLHSNDWHVTQKPDQNNGFATIMKMDVEGHPTGVLLCETVWKNCSIWDAKAILSCSEAREIWDSMFEKGEYICSVTPSCSIWHSKLKSAWPASPRDYVAFTAQYTSCQRVDICSTSCIGNTYEHYHLPKETSDFVRATLDLSGWRLDRLDMNGDDGDNDNNLSTDTIDKKSEQSNSISVRYVLQTHFQGWIPWFLLNQLTTQAPNVPTSAYQYLERYGAPPCVEELIMATMQQHRYDHTKKNWRLEYTRSITIGEQGPTTVTVRLDRRRWAFNSSSGGNHYNITVDPPPSKVITEARKEDPYGVWLIIEHDESFIIPRRGKILVLIKPGKNQQHQVLQKKKKHNPITLMINGSIAPIQNDTAESLDSSDLNEHDAVQSSKTHLRMNPSPESESPKATTSATTPPSPSLSGATTSDTGDEMDEHIRNLEVVPMEQAQAALLLLKRMDEQFGWTVVSDKQGLRINKRSGTKSSSATTKSKPIPSTSTSSTTTAACETTSMTDNGGRSTSQLENYYLDVCDPYMIYKSSKVIENFSIEEVASVVTNVSDVRTVYDSSLEKCEVVKPIQRGCQVIRQEIKGIFPFKSRELYLVSCTAVEKTVGAPSSKRILYVESSIDMPIIKSSKLPRGKMFISGWILEPIDPYTTAANHPIPSMRATYVVALDLGSSIPSYLSNMTASGIVSKKIHGVEQYLKQKGPLPYLVHPPPMVGFRKNKCVDIQTLVDDEDNSFFSSSNTSSSSSSSDSNNKNNTSSKDADKPIYPSTTATTTTSTSTMKSTRMTTMQWCDVQAIYGEEPVLTLKSLCQYQQPPPPITPRSAMTSSFAPVPSPNHQQSTSSIPIQPTASHSSSWMDRRRSSTSTITSYRRGSMPPGSPTSSAAAAATAAAVAATKQRKIELENSTHLANTMVDPILCEAVVDLQMFSEGYDVIVSFRQHQISDATNDAQSCDENDLSGLLSVTVSKLTPTPSHILLSTIGGSSAPPGKHSVQVKLIASSLSQTTLFQPKDMDMFDLELTLQHHRPVVTKTTKNGGSTASANTEHNLDENERKDRLTMSDVLGDDNDDDGNTKQNSGSYSASRWQGVVFVDGQMVSKYGDEIKIKSKRKPTSSAQPLLGDHDKKLVTVSSPYDSTDSGMDYNKPSYSTSTNEDTGQQQQKQQQKQKQHEKLNDTDRSLDDTSLEMATGSAPSSDLGDPTVAVPYLGEGVVSAALGGVNDFRMRLMLPFKNHHPPSSTTSIICQGDSGQMTSIHPQGIGKDDYQTNNKSTMIENGDTTGQVNEFYYSHVTTTQHGTLWTLRMVISIGMICLCILCVLTLLLLQPRTVVFEAGQQPIYSLCRFPWFGGWQIQLVASDYSSFTVT